MQLCIGQRFPSQFLVLQPPSVGVPHDMMESATIAIFILAFIVAERLFVQVAEQMIRFDERS